MALRARAGERRRAYTLVEVLIVVTILGIASAMLIPAMGSTGVLRVQAAVRQVVSDLTVTQSEALAYQRGRAVIFDVASNAYSVVEIRGGTIDAENNTLSTTELNSATTYGDARIVSAEFDGDATLIFDAMGAPARAVGDENPPATGVIVIEGSGNRFRVEIDGYTGRISVFDQGPIGG